MKKKEITLHQNCSSEFANPKDRALCEKCGGSGNLKTPENSRRTCLSCFGRGFRVENFNKI